MMLTIHLATSSYSSFPLTPTPEHFAGLINRLLPLNSQAQLKPGRSTSFTGLTDQQRRQYIREHAKELGKHLPHAQKTLIEEVSGMTQIGG